ncbi:hypothetical protein B9Z55_007893 [Caenorhabditis nigoni]|uniref:BTB domain-containing protein n=1 Tax=Caenorhabditis nigoni TaxID=1611254 RepID=A0A2G5VBP2_9PELO|nr:hypothetical protein B9Z55_007893 [Caenorhabditis nigoni]
MTDTVKLNVGGTIFQTTKSTLTKFDGFFRTMFETPVPITKDESEAIFVDRDPTHSRLILNFMRDGHVDLQKYLEDVKEIQKEAEYYLLNGLVELCNRIQSENEKPEEIKELKDDRDEINAILGLKKKLQRKEMAGVGLVSKFSINRDLVATLQILVSCSPR